MVVEDFTLLLWRRLELEEYFVRYDDADNHRCDLVGVCEYHWISELIFDLKSESNKMSILFVSRIFQYKI